MRQVNIKLNYNSIVSLSSRDIGFVGEHNATELIIEVPQQCITDADCFLLNFNDGRLDIVSHIITDDTREDGAWVEDGKIHCVLWQQLTRGQNLSITVEGYKYSGEKLVSLFKLPRIENLRLRPVNEGSIKPCKDVHGLQAQIQRLLAIVSAHGSLQHTTNMLNRLSIENNKLLFDGNEIITEDVLSGIYDAISEINETLSQAQSSIDSINLDLPNYATKDWVLTLLYTFNFDSDGNLCVLSNSPYVRSDNNGNISIGIDNDITRINNNNELEVFAH